MEFLVFEICPISWLAGDQLKADRIRRTTDSTAVTRGCSSEPIAEIASEKDVIVIKWVFQLWSLCEDCIVNSISRDMCLQQPFTHRAGCFI